MRPRHVLFVLLCLAACGQDKARQAAEQEHVELAACRTTYPIRPGLFAALVRCELGAAANYIQLVDPSERTRQQHLATDLQARADAVDAGSLTADQWRAKASETVDALPSDARQVRQATSAIL